MRKVLRGAIISIALSACGSEPVPIGDLSGAVIDGTPQDGMDATVRLRNVWGGLCSGSIVAPRVVMTAKHCLDRGVFGWQIGIGPTGNDAEYDIDDVFLTDDGGAEVYQNEDIAFAILDTPVEDVVPYLIPWDDDRLGTGDDIRLIGYGGTEDGTAGRKFETTDRIVGVGDFEFTTSGNGVCGGDSGGTGLHEDGVTAVGVIVRGPKGECLPEEGGRGTALTRVYAWLDLAREAFDATGACYPTGAEVCDGRDNDCDGVVDSGCEPMGAPCAMDDDCSSETCAEVEGERICTADCDPGAPADGCGDGAYCRQAACGEGSCVAGAAGETAAGESCESDVECASLRCAEQGVCAEPCAAGAGQCAPGQVCSAPGCDRGLCIDADVAPDAPRGLGEPCGSDGDCAAGACVDGDFGKYCSAACAEGACPAGYHCEADRCLRGDPGEAGDPCRTDSECASGLCARWDNGSACTEACDTGYCPDGLSCVDTGGGRFCEPDAWPTGSPCAVNGDCLRGLCGRFYGGDYCTETCDEGVACPGGFECVATANDEIRVCARHFVAPGGDGCAVAGSPRTLAPALLALAALVRRRRRA